MNIDNVKRAYRQAYVCTFNTLAFDDTFRTKLALKLSSIISSLNTSSLMSMSSAITTKKLLDEDEDIENFILRLTSRFFCLVDYKEVDDLIKQIYWGCNIHNSYNSDSMSNKLLINIPKRMYGDENNALQFTEEEVLTFMSVNKWYLGFCLFALYFDGTHFLYE